MDVERDVLGPGHREGPVGVDAGGELLEAGDQVRVELAISAVGVEVELDGESAQVAHQDPERRREGGRFRVGGDQNEAVLQPRLQVGFVRTGAACR